MEVSEVCLGTMTFGYQSDEAASFAILDRAAAAGVDFIDTADCYPVPLTLGDGGADRGDPRPVAARQARSVRRRHEVLLPDGPGPEDRGNGRRHVLQAAEASLRRLQTEAIDLYQLHAFDTETPLEETLRALEDLVASGKVRAIGCSNFRAFELATALGVSDRLTLARFTSAQPRYNVLYARDRDRARAAVPRGGRGRDRLQPAGGRPADGQARAGAAPRPGQPVRRDHGRHCPGLQAAVLAARGAGRRWHHSSPSSTAGANRWPRSRWPGS
jgi:aryl-alcohol dehydrogenase (NADP+)